MLKSMLGVNDVRGPITDLLDKLGGQEGERWLEETKRFLRRENPFIETGKNLSLIRDVQKLLSKRFGKKIVVDPLPQEFTSENLGRIDQGLFSLLSSVFLKTETEKLLVLI